MKKTAKILSLILVITMILSGMPMLEVVADSLVAKENFQNETPTAFTEGGSDIEAIYQKDGDNVYWYVGHAVADETSPGGQTFLDYHFSDMLTDTTLTSGDYVVSFRFKCDNTNGWSHPAAVRLMAKSGGENAHFKLDEIKTKVGSTSTEETKVSFNNTVLTKFLCKDKFIESGEWYTFQATYHLNKKVATFDLYNSAGEQIIETQNATLPASEITLSSISVGLDSRFKPQIGIDEITVTKIEKEETEEEQKPIVGEENFQSKTPTEFTAENSEIEAIYQKENDNIYWYVGHAVADETSPGGQTFQDYSFSEFLGNTTLKSGEYVVSFRFKCDNTNGWSHPAAVRLMAKSGGENAHFKLDEIKTKVGSTSTETTKVLFNNDVLTTFLCTDKLIKSGEWYTFRATYQLDEKKASLDLYNPAGEPIIETQNVTLPAPEITLSSISVGLDSRFKPQIGIDDITVTKIEKKEPVLIQCNISENGTVMVNNEAKKNGDVIEIENGGSLEVVAEPDENFYISSIKLGDITGVLTNGKYVFENVSTNAELKVLFAEIDGEYTPIIGEENFQGKTPTEFTEGESEIEAIYQKENDNVYWYVGHAVADGASAGGQVFKSYSFSEFLSNTTFTSGEYVVSFRFKCDNTDGWSHPAAVRLITKSGGENAYFRLDEIKTKVGSTSTETTKVSFNNDVLTSFLCTEKLIKSGEWYTIQATYQLDEQKASFDLYNPAGEPIIETQNVTLPSSEITLSAISVGLDARYYPQVGIDDITVKKVEKSETVLIRCNIGENGTVIVNNETKKNGDVIEIANGGSLEVVAEPKDNFRIASVKLGNVTGVRKEGKYVFENISKNAELTVSFAESNGEYSQIVGKENFQSKSPSEFLKDSSDIEVIYQKEENNLYWYAGHDIEDEFGGTQVANFSLSDLVNDTSFKSGEYVVSFRFKCDNTDGWSQKAEVGLWATSGGEKANFRISSIETKVGSTSEDRTVISFNDEQLTSFLCIDKIIKSGEWYTLQAVYNLDLKKATFSLYDKNNEKIIDTLSTALPTSEITFSRISAGLDSRYMPKIGLDDIIVSRTERVPVVVSCNYGGKVICEEQTVTFRDGGKPVAVDYNSDQQAVFQIVPDEGYNIQSVMVNGEAVTPINNTVSFINLREAQDLKVVFEGGSSEQPTVMEFYVSPEGNDSHSGDIDHPLAMINGIKDRLRSMEKTYPVKVYFREGVYPVDNTIIFNEEDSGTKECPITYAAYPGETVKFSGSIRLDSSKLKKVTDPAILSRVIDEEAREKLMYLDLGEQGIGTLPTPPDEYGRAYWFPFKEAAVYYDGMELTSARWPNDDFLKTATVKTTENYQEDPFSLTYTDDTHRTKLWSKATLEADDVYIGMRNSFSFSGIRLGSVSPEINGITSKGGTDYQAQERCIFYFFNIIDEIDVPGESYLDRENKIIYFYPPNNNQTPEMEIANLEGPIISLKNASYLNFEGLTFDGSKEQLVTADTVNHINFNGCEISRCSNTAMHLKKITDSTIENCHIFDAGNGGIRVEGSGDRTDLTSGNLKILNNKIHNTDRFVVTYAPGVYLDNSVGALIEHNEIYDADQMLINFNSSNDVQINYNHIYDAARLFDDTGAIYFGRDMSMLGTEIKYNYFHHIGNLIYPQFGSQSIFCDDFVPGPKIYGNIFYHGSISSDDGGTPKYNAVVRTYFGQYMQMKNNIIIDAPAGLSYGTNSSGKMFRWLMAMYSVKPMDMGWNLWAKMQDWVENPEWNEHYKSSQWSFVTNLKKEYKEQLEELSAKYNYTDSQDKKYHEEMIQYAESIGFFDKDSKVFSENLLVKVDQPFWSGNWATDTVLVENNYNMTYQAAQNAFSEFGKDFTLTDSALTKIRETIPNFEKINFNDIGIKPYTLNGVVGYPGAAKPAVTEISVSGSIMEGRTVNAVYTFEDADGDPEGYSSIAWYLSDSKDGKYTEVQSGVLKDFSIPENTAGNYLKCAVTPIDCHGVRGETIESDALLIIDPADANLSDLQINGKTVTGFKKDKKNYIVTAGEIPKITAIPFAEEAIVEITQNSETLPVKFTITVTAPDGKTTKTYVVAVSMASSESTPPTVTPDYGSDSNGGVGNPGSNNGITGNVGSMGSSGGIAGSIGNGTTVNKFVDIIGHWAENDILEMHRKGIVSGVTETSFEPDRSITRAEFAALITRALKLSSANTESVFNDVADDAWYADEVATAAAAGLIAGYEGNYRPEDTITREEMAVVIMKAYTFLGKTASKGQIEKFADKDIISDWALEYVDQAASVGFISGMTPDSFVPKENATRAQVVSVIKRLLNQ